VGFSKSVRVAVRFDPICSRAFNKIDLRIRSVLSIDGQDGRGL